MITKKKLTKLNSKISIAELINLLKVKTNTKKFLIYRFIYFFTNIPTDQILINKNKVIQYNKSELNKYVKLFSKNIPLEYIFNKAVFLNKTIYITKPILIPRPETEMLVEIARKELTSFNTKKNNLKILDIGCGSGSISLALKDTFENAFITLLDPDKKAIKISKKNLKLLLNINFQNKTIEKFLNHTKNKYDVIISNPPYIDIKNEKNDMSKDVKKYESSKALYAKNNGLYFYDFYFKNLQKILNHEFYIFLEFGFNQKEKIENLILNSSFKNHTYKFLKDDSNKYRFLIIKNY